MRALAKTLAVVVLALWSSSARADEPWLVGGGIDFAAPVTDSMRAQFLPGGEVSFVLRRPVDRTFAFGVRVFGGLLFDGPAPTQANRVDPGLGTWFGAGLALRIRPQFDGDGPDRARGLSLEFEAGFAMTGELVRPELSATLAYGIDVDGVVIEPRVRVTHIVHWDDPIDASQGVLVLAGIGLVFGEPHDAPVLEDAALPPAVLDTDGDGILDPDDVCITQPEDLDGLADLDGCPEDDFDGDGIRDPDDGCPDVAEDMDGVHDSDGCPEDDEDRDGILDPVDACPEAAEVVNGVADSDGCPDEGLIELEGDRVVLDERVLFETSRARVRHAARPILRAIAALFMAHPEWTSLRIEGHADERGEEEYNRELSERRATRVREALLEYGVPETRMESIGYGEARPREAGVYDANRRVEFVMISGPALAPSAEPGAEPSAEPSTEPGADPSGGGL